MTLIEILIAMVVLALGVVAVLSALTVLAASSFIANERADVGAALRSASEAVKGANYVSCKATPKASYTAAAATVPLPTFNKKAAVKTPTVVAVTKGTGASLVACPSDPGLQRVELQVTSQDGKTNEHLWVVKLNPATL
jgi:type II secretory pathway pseudopilin PulG